MACSCGLFGILLCMACQDVLLHLSQVPTPDTYRGKYREDSLSPGHLYANEVKVAINKALENGRTVSI